MDASRSLRTTVIASFLFFCSGALGLGYPLVWIREAALVVGASRIALSAVVSAFFVGVAVGSFWLGRRGRASGRSSLLVYGLFELGIGAFALAFPLLIRGLEAVYAAAYPTFAGSAVGLFALRFGLLFLLFIPPTFLMGGSLPLLLDGLAATGTRIGYRASGLYGLNLAGAAIGALATSYLAIPRIGMVGTAVALGLLNLALGAIAVAAFRSKPAEARETVGTRVAPVLCALAFASGVLVLGYQVAWARYFSLIQLGTVHLAAVLLAVFLAALAAGSLTLAPLLRIGWNPLRLAGVAQCLAPIAALACLGAWRFADYRVAARDPSQTLEIAPDFAKFWRFFNETADATFFAPVFQVALTLFLPVALFGVGLPAFIAAAARRPEQVRSASGRLVAWNTLGSCAGSLLAGYVLLPLVGLHGALAVLGVGMTALGAFALRRAGGGHSWRRSLLVPSVCAGIVIVLWVVHHDGSLRIGSGAVQGAGVGRRTIEGHLSVLLYAGREEPRERLWIGLDPRQSFAGDPRVAVPLDDGRHFVARAAAASFNVVSMESAPPIVDGAHHLYTVEFYRDVRRVLRAGGVFMQAMPLDFFSPSDVRCVLRTLAGVFPDTFVLRVSPSDLVLLAYRSAPRFDRRALREGILSMIVTAPEDVRRIDAPFVLRDDRPLLSYSTGDRWLTRRYAGPALVPISFATLPRTAFEDLREIVDPPLSDEEVETLTTDRVSSLHAFRVPHPREIERKNLALELAESAGERADRALDLALMYDAELDKESAFRSVEKALEALAGDPGQARPDQLETARSIVRNRVAVYADLCASWIGRFERRFASSALLEAMRDELLAHHAREAEMARAYLVP